MIEIILLMILWAVPAVLGYFIVKEGHKYKAEHQRKQVVIVKRKH